jgi:hypothetical protein
LRPKLKLNHELRRLAPKVQISRAGPSITVFPPQKRSDSDPGAEAGVRPGFGAFLVPTCAQRRGQVRDIAEV